MRKPSRFQTGGVRQLAQTARDAHPSPAEKRRAPTQNIRERMSRRSVLKGAGALLAGAAVGAAACSDSTQRESAMPTNPTHPTAAPTAVATSVPSSVDFPRVASELQRSITEHRVDGLGLVIVRDGRVLFREAFGTSTTETILLLYSATKLASATAVMAVIDEGLARLDDSISHFLPAFSGVNGTITIRQLLSQTHGLPANHPSIATPQRDNGLTLAESVDQIARDLQPEYTPGSRFRYAPAASYAISGRIAEIVTGQNWSDLFAARVGGPLQMGTFTYGPGQNPRVGGGAVCALDDYANLLQMHLEGGTFGGRRILSDSSVREMREDQLGGIPFVGGVQKAETGYGLAWWFDERDASGDAFQFSVPGGLGAIPWIDVERRYGAFLLLQKTLPAGVAVFDAILPLIKEALNG